MSEKTERITFRGTTDYHWELKQAATARRLKVQGFLEQAVELFRGIRPEHLTKVCAYAAWLAAEPEPRKDKQIWEWIRGGGKVVDFSKKKAKKEAG